MKDYELEKAATEYANSIAQHEHNKIFSIDDFKAGAKWREEQFEKIEKYKEEGLYSSGDDEYVYGISFDEPVKLPVEFYIKKK